MSQANNLNYKSFYFTAAICLFISISLFICSYSVGKIDLFLWLNGDGGKITDQFFYWFTHLGDGLLWIAWIAIILIIRRFDLVKLLVFSFVFSTLFTQFFKYIILPNEARPKTAIVDQSLIHFVEGVNVHSINSFPSGHTATAFTFLLLISLLANKNWVVFISLIAAILVGYSRVYIAQHFPFDVAGGILVAICSLCATLIVLKISGRKNKLQEKLA